MISAEQAKTIALVREAIYPQFIYVGEFDVRDPDNINALMAHDVAFRYLVWHRKQTLYMGKRALRRNRYRLSEKYFYSQIFVENPHRLKENLERFLNCQVKRIWLNGQLLDRNG